MREGACGWDMQELILKQVSTDSLTSRPATPLILTHFHA